jgi:outer membrane protein TolC
MAVLGSALSVSWAAESVPPAPPTVVENHPLSLAECIQIALQRQPSLAAYRASLAAAETSLNHINQVHIPTCLKPDLPARRCQAALGVGIAQATLDRAERDTVHAVTRAYLGILYARAQQAAANATLTVLKARKEEAQKLLTDRARVDVTARSITSVEVALLLAQTVHDEAGDGLERGRAALREAMGVGPDYCLEVPETPLPNPPALDLCRGDIVALALARRSEIVTAGKAAELVALEVNAQCALRRFKTSTFAASADIHADPLPVILTGPGEQPLRAVGIEMPVTLNGSRCFRVERMQLSSARADAVVEKTRNLIVLDAEDAYLKWKESERRRVSMRDAADLADRMADEARAITLRIDDPKTPPAVKYDEALTAIAVAGQLRIQALDGLFKYDLALANLERATNGGFCAGLAP